MKSLATLPIQKIISGGQTGVDRAALDFAISNGIAHGGWCPAGRHAADGVLDDRYQLIETKSSGYSQRTKLNVQNSDATLIIYRSELIGGSLLTRSFATRFQKPLMSLNLNDTITDNHARWHSWIDTTFIRLLNIAGPSEDRCPGIYQQTFDMLNTLLAGSDDN